VIGASLLVAQLKLRMLPDVKRLAQEESELAGLYRNAHARLLASAEEVALFQGGRRERALLDALAARLFRASVQLSRAQLFLGVLDHYLVRAQADGRARRVAAVAARAVRVRLQGGCAIQSEAPTGRGSLRLAAAASPAAARALAAQPQQAFARSAAASS
jgi:hypothetical protein